MTMYCDQIFRVTCVPRQIFERLLCHVNGHKTLSYRDISGHTVIFLDPYLLLRFDWLGEKKLKF